VVQIGTTTNRIAPAGRLLTTSGCDNLEDLLVTTSSTPVLEVCNLTRRFGALVAVRDVSFEVAEGEVLGIAGPNGSGKSTLFNVITGIPFGPTSGKVIFKGRQIQNLSPNKISSLGLLRTFQKDAEFPTLSAIENVSCAAVYCVGKRGREARASAESALDRVGFSKTRRSMRAGDLSAYERKQLMMASAIAGEPKVLLLDEPAAGLTRLEINDLADLILMVRGQGVSIVVIEHRLSLLLKVSERLMILNQGAVLAHGDPKDVVNDEHVLEAYLGKRVAIV
jgi:branched-chain amino acid transport system ATP-binding protein